MSQPRILVADDSRTIQTIIRRALVEHGYAVTVVSDGRQAVVAAREQCPQLVILDVLMPEMDGFSACLEIRDLGAAWRTMPIIFLSRVRANALDTLGSQLGAYLSKPVCTEQLLGTVKSLLDNHPTASRVAAGAIPVLDSGVER